jgi:hypothetical protein
VGDLGPDFFIQIQRLAAFHSTLTTAATNTVELVFQNGNTWKARGEMS